MAENFKIGAGLALDGEKEFKQAISGINKDLSVLGSEMKKVTAQFDGNANSMEALSAKQKVYNNRADEQRKKIEVMTAALESAKKEFGENSDKVKDWQIKLNNAEADLAKTEKTLNETTDQINSFGKNSKDGGDAIDKAGRQAEGSEGRFEKLGGVLKSVGVAMGAVAVAAGAAAIKLGKEVVKQFGELEQNLGGSEAVFGEYAASIQKTGEDAYKNLGVSQSDYLATANKMGALFQGSGIEQQKSLSLTEQAMQRAADMASVMGIDMQVALDSVAGAAKGNFTMMDNLGVAMNATNIEAYALAKGLDFTWNTATQAEKAEVAMQMFFDNTSQYAGNFARESTQTVTGSIGLMKAALGSFTAGLGNADADMAKLTRNMVDAFQAVVRNIVPIVENLTAALPVAFDGILGAVGELLPTLLRTATTLFRQVLDAVLQLFPELIPVVVESVMTIVDALIDNLPLIIDGALQLVLALALGIADALPELIPAVVEVVFTIVETLVDNIDMLVDASIAIIVALADGLIEALPRLIEKAPEIIIKIVQALADNIPKIVEAGIGIVLALGGALVQAIPDLLKAIPQIMVAVRDALLGYYSTMAGIGKNLITGLWQGIRDAGDWLWEKISGFFDGIVGRIKGFFGIESPSKLFRDEIGKNLADGIGVGFLGQMETVAQQMNDSIPTSFDAPLMSATRQTVEGAVNGMAALMAGNSGGTYNINLVVDGRTLASVVFDPLRGEARRRGVALA
jgi:phage-related protein